MADSKIKKLETPLASGEKSLLDESRPEADEVQLTQPKDTLKLVYLVFVLHGIGIMLPWNSFINANEYFLKHKFNNIEADYKKNFMNYIGLASQLPNLLLAAFNVFFQSTRPTVQAGSSIPKLMFVIAIEIVVCIFTCALAIADSTGWPRVFFDLTILSVIVLNCCTGVYQSSAFGMAALLPMTYSNAIVLGSNICGTLIALANIFCKLASASDLQTTAISYFTFSTLLLFCCFVSLIPLPRLRFFRHFQTKLMEIPMTEVAFTAIPTCEDGGDVSVKDATQTTLTLDTSCDNSAKQGQLLMPAATCSKNANSPASKPVTCEQYTDTAKECCACFCGIESFQIARRYWLRYWLALKDGWVHCLSVWSVFFCTLSCFPAVVSKMEPVWLSTDWFVDVYVFLFFNLFAMIGNIVSNFVQFPSSRRLAYAVWSRTLLCIPFFVMCNCFPGNRPNFPVIIRSDAAFILGMIVFAFTSGYFSSLCMMYAPRCVKHPEYANLVAMLATFFLVFGVFCGVSFGTFLTNVIQVGELNSTSTTVGLTWPTFNDSLTTLTSPILNDSLTTLTSPFLNDSLTTWTTPVTSTTASTIGSTSPIFSTSVNKDTTWTSTVAPTSTATSATFNSTFNSTG